jgi:hypothetical protein
MVRLYGLLGRDYKPKQRPIWVYSERRQTATSLVMSDEATRTVGSRKEHHRTGRISLVIGNVSDILAQQDGVHSPGIVSPRKSLSFARGSLKSDVSSLNHYIPNRNHIMNSARQRKVSTVTEETQADDGIVQEHGPTAVTSKPLTKSHDSDEEVQGSNPEPYPGHIDNSKDSAFEVTGGQILSAPTGQSLRLSEDIANTSATNIQADSGTAEDNEIDI